MKGGDRDPDDCCLKVYTLHVVHLNFKTNNIAAWSKKPGRNLQYFIDRWPVRAEPSFPDKPIGPFSGPPISLEYLLSARPHTHMRLLIFRIIIIL